jgi:lysophospholipase L1-like esterase
MPIASPNDIANCELYLDADDSSFSDAGSTPCSVGDTIRQLSDRSGNGRHATQATGANRPTFTTIEGVGAARHLSSHYLDTGSFLDSSWDTSITAVLVHEPETSAGFQIVSTDASDKFRHAISAASNVEATSLYTPGLSDNVLDPTVSRQSLRVEVIRYNGSTKRVRIAGPDSDTSFSESATGNLALGATWRLGDYGPSLGFGYAGFTRALALYKRSLTDGEVDDLVAWSLAKFAAHSNGSHSGGGGDAMVVCDGNSLTAGQGGTSYPTQLDALLGAGWAVTNKGISGQYIGHMITDRYRSLNEIDALFNPSATKNICVYFEGINDVQNGASGENSFQRHKQYGLRRKYKGWQTIVCTCPPAGITTGTKETARQNLNTLLRANWAEFADALVDLDADPAFDDPNDLTYYDADTIHWTTAGYAVVAGLVKDAIDNLPLPTFSGPGFLSSPFRF